MSSQGTSPGKINLPTLRGRMGDWMYYITLLNMDTIAERVSMVSEIHNNAKLSEWIQRRVSANTADIVKYLENQEQRFFNSIILGIYGGKPSWQEIEIRENSNVLQEETILYLDKTFGVLSLSGNEKIFAIDGQHRVKAIKEALRKSSNSHLVSDEVPAIFLAHRETEEGRQRTRRLFTTLNRYAKPVKKSDIIALDEDDNCAVITRSLFDDFPLFENKILLSRTKSIPPNNSINFTSIITLYDVIVTLLTNKKIATTIEVQGASQKEYLNRRVDEEDINQMVSFLKYLFEDICSKIPVLNAFFYKNQLINRQSQSTSLLFRPIGQNVFFMVLKVCIEKGFYDDLVLFFTSHDFSLENPVWKKVFWNEELENINTNKSAQNYATLLLCKKMGIEFKLSPTYEEIFQNYGFTVDDLK